MSSEASHLDWEHKQEPRHLHTLIIGVSWRTASAELRDRCYLNTEQASEFLLHLQTLGVAESLVISTCNRVEFWIACDDPQVLQEQVLQVWEQRCDLPVGWRGSVFVYSHDEAVRHAFHVSASIDSLVLGESQINTQVRNAYGFSRAQGTAGFFLGRLVQSCISAAGLVRSRTRLAEGAVSISSAAVDLARKITGDLDRLVVGIVGAGEMAELALTGFVRAGTTRFVYANRTAANVHKLVNVHPGRVESLEALPKVLAECDVVVSATGATGFVITPSMVQQVMTKRRKPLFLLDIAAPRDIDPASGTLNGVFLYGIDDLEQVVDRNRKARGHEAQAAEQMLASECEKFRQWYCGLAVVPVLTQLRSHVQGLASKEVERFFPRVQKASPEELRPILEDFAQAIANKVLHAPTVGARKAALEGREHEVADLFRELFLGGDAR